jgi:hypothetical protein
MKQEPLDVVEYKGCTVEIHPDENPINPREDFEHFGTMACWHRNYHLGDKPYSDGNPEDFIRGLAQDADRDFENKIDARFEEEEAALTGKEWAAK